MNNLSSTTSSRDSIRKDKQREQQRLYRRRQRQLIRAHESAEEKVLRLSKHAAICRKSYYAQKRRKIELRLNKPAVHNLKSSSVHELNSITEQENQIQAEFALDGVCEPKITKKSRKRKLSNRLPCCPNTNYKATPQLSQVVDISGLPHIALKIVHGSVVEVIGLRNMTDVTKVVSVNSSLQSDGFKHLLHSGRGAKHFLVFQAEHKVKSGLVNTDLCKIKEYRRSSQSSPTKAVMQKRQSKLWKRQVQLALALDIGACFPTSQLVAMNKEHQGKTNTDYGGHIQGLNFQPNAPDGKKSGRLVVGMRFDSDHRTKSNTVACQKSTTTYKPIIQQVHVSLQYNDINTVPKAVWDTLRVEFQCGNQTLPHNDSFYGFTPNAVMFHEPLSMNTRLRVQNFPLFRCSVVSFRGVHYIPMSVSKANNSLKMYGFDKERQGAQKYLFEYDVIKDLLPVGRFDDQFIVCGIKQLIVCGIKQSMIQYFPCSHKELVPSPTWLPLMTMERAMQIGRSPANEHKDGNMHRTTNINKPFVWNKF